MQTDIPFREHDIEWNDENVARLWNYYARNGGDDIYFAKRFGHRILKASGLPLNDRLKVLDFGCGPGFMWEHIKNLCAEWQYTGLDFSESSIEKVKSRASGDDQFAGAACVESLPTALPDAEFDAILLLEVVEHLKDEYLRETLKEANRLLKPGGVVVITTPNEEDLSACTKFCPECGSIFHEWQHVRTWNVDELQRAVERYGFRMRAGRVLDFSAVGIKGYLIRVARQAVLGKKSAPHMIATFEKR